MKLIIAGPRDFNPTLDLILGAIQTYSISLTEIVSGCAKGVDTKALDLYEYMKSLDFKVSLKKFPVEKSDWDTYGKVAGHIRNRQMAEYADALLLIWREDSPGSRNMKEQMLSLKKPIYEVVVRSVL